jgi:hypothetical protein
MWSEDYMTCDSVLGFSGLLISVGIALDKTNELEEEVAEDNVHF